MPLFTFTYVLCEKLQIVVSHSDLFTYHCMETADVVLVLFPYVFINFGLWRSCARAPARGCLSVLS